MSIQRTPTEELARHIDVDDEFFTSEEAAELILDVLEDNGGSFVVLESEYWGKEAFGPDHWVETFFGHQEHETEKGVKFERCVRTSKLLGALRRRNKAQAILDGEHESAYDHLDEAYWEEQLDEAETEIRAFGQRLRRGGSLGGGWLPKSKVIHQVSREGPAEFVVFTEDGETDQRVHKDDAEVTIYDTIVKRTRTAQYTNLAIDIPYDPDFSPKEDIEELTWDDHKFTAHYDHTDTFVCWVADTMPREVASILAEHYESVAVHESVLDNHDG